MSKRRKTHDSSSSPASSSLPSSTPASSTPLSSSPPSSSPASNSIGIVSPSDASVPLHEEELIYDIEKLHHDPIRRTDIMKYPPNDMDEDAAFCFVCYLFKNEVGHAGGDAFVNKGFKSWNKPERFIKHIGGVRSAHNIAYEKYVNLRDGKKKSILVSLDNVSDVINNEYNVRLKASISCLRYLLGQGMAFRGHREGEDSLNRGNFLELLKWLKAHNEVISKVTLENAPENCQLTSPTIQKDIINCCAKETMKRIVDDLGDDYFAILADESSDVSQKEQLLVCAMLKRKGERSAIMTLLVEHSLSPSKVRGQEYDEASNMKGEIHGLKTLIMKDTPSAYYVHCFAHQLQLTLVAISKKNDDCSWLFETVSILLNVIGVSCKRNELLREVQAQKVAQALEIGELESGSGFNQELSLKKPGDTHMKAHYSPHGRSKRFVQQVSYLHHFRVDVFIKVIDLLLQELDNRFDEVNMELLRCMACFNPKDGFSSFDKEKVLKLATFYPSDFSNIDLMDLECQLDIFIGDMRSDEDFQNLRDISSLLVKLVET
ncbi:zinc finger MYM-type protein 1-like [Salvia splendens]|uniref:zinc finger MYM-type protein 1-like n=1 Tax=Salvia splendens TaxID=180675 RepID=UPI001C25DE63|nr:zinc finger MYM-type protein 1-like [Salvia splendens]